MLTYIHFHEIYFQVSTSLNEKVNIVEIHPTSQFFENFATFCYVNYDVINLLRHNYGFPKGKTYCFYLASFAIFELLTAVAAKWLFQFKSELRVQMCVPPRVKPWSH